MATLDDRAALTDEQDRLIDFFVQRDEASRAEDWPRVARSIRKLMPQGSAGIDDRNQ